MSKPIKELTKEWTLEDVANYCKGAVYLRINEFKNDYETLEEHLKKHKEYYDNDISEEQVDKILQAKIMFNLQFYPDTPVGSCNCYGTTLQEVVNEAMNYLTNKEL